MSLILVLSLVLTNPRGTRTHTHTHTHTHTLLQLLKSLSKEEHPFNAFSTGNVDTLGGVKREDGKDARESCIEFHEQFYSANIMKVCVYGKQSLDEMQTWAEEAFRGVTDQNLPAVQPIPPNPFSSKELSKYVEVVPVKDKKTCYVMFPTPAVDEPRVRSVGNNGAAGASKGCVANAGGGAAAPLYHSNPMRYLSHLIGHEGKGSILYALKEKNYAIGLGAGLFHRGSSFGVMQLSVELTDEGLENVNDVVACVFAYCGMLSRSHAHLSSSSSSSSAEAKDAQAQEDLKWIPQELFDMEQCAFRFKQEGQPANEVINIAENLHKYPIEHTLSADQVLYDIDSTQQLAMDLYLGGTAGEPSVFGVDNSLIVVTAKAFTGTTQHKEKWYQTDYNITDYDAVEGGQALSSWHAAHRGEDKWAALVHLPCPNDLLPTDFTLKHECKAELKEKGAAQLAPTLLTSVGKAAPAYDSYTAAAAAAADGDSESNSNSSSPVTSAVLWHLGDEKWQQPQCRLNIKFWAPSLIGNSSGAQSVVMADLYRGVIEELLNEELYYAECAMMKFSMSVERGALSLSLRGYSHKMQGLLRTVLLEMKAVGSAGHCSQNIFDRVKELQLRTYKNQALFSAPYMLAFRASAECMYDPLYNPKEKYRVLQQLSLTQFDAFAAAFVQEPMDESGEGGGPGMHTESFFFGNITDAEAQDVLMSTVVPILKYTPLPLHDRMKPVVRVTALAPRHEYVLRNHCKDFDADQPNSAVENSYFVGDVSSFSAPIAQRLRTVAAAYADAGAADEADKCTEAASVCADDALVADSMVTFLAHVMHEAAFNQLRTIEQLGYIVHVGQSNVEHRFFLRVIVQSDCMDAAGLDSRIEMFLRTYYRDFLCDDDCGDEDNSDLPPKQAATNDEAAAASTDADALEVEGPLLADEDTFAEYIESLCDKLLEPPISFSDEYNTLFAEISCFRYAFDRKAKMAALLRQLQFADVKRFWNTFIRKTNSDKGWGRQRCKFTSQFFGKDTHFPVLAEAAGQASADTTVELVSSPAEFKARRATEPAVYLPK